MILTCVTLVNEAISPSVHANYLRSSEILKCANNYKFIFHVKAITLRKDFTEQIRVKCMCTGVKNTHAWVSEDIATQ